MFDILSGEFAWANIRWSTRSVLSLSSTQYSSLLVQNVFFQFTKIAQFYSFHVATQLRFLNRLPEYVLAIQFVQGRASRLCSRSCALWLAFPNLYGWVVLLCGAVDLKRVLASS